jgi:hypothetical protein
VLDNELHALERVNEIITNPRVLGRPHRMRPLRDLLDVLHGVVCREPGLSNQGRRGEGRTTQPDAAGGKGNQANGGEDSGSGRGSGSHDAGLCATGPVPVASRLIPVA